MSLFKRLQRFGSTADRDQTEDFFTESVAGLFQQRPELLKAWLRQCEVPISDEARVNLSTQVEYPKQTDTACGRRPDMQLLITENDGSRHVIFVESKLDASEGGDQLVDYARVLRAQFPEVAFKRRTLLYVTKRFESKEAQSVVERRNDVEFKTDRWHHFYQMLRTEELTQPPHYYRDQLLRFMEELGMATPNQFAPEDFVGLSALKRAVAVMKEVLTTDVETEFKQVLGLPSRSLNPDQLVTKDRYVLRGTVTHLQVLLGFFLVRGEPGYPTLGLMLEVRPNSVLQPDLFESLEHEKDTHGWSSKRLEERNSYAGIVKEQSLRVFVARENQVEAMKRYCTDLLNELKRLKSEQPTWFGEVSDEDEVGDESLQEQD